MKPETGTQIRVKELKREMQNAHGTLKNIIHILKSLLSNKLLVKVCLKKEVQAKRNLFLSYSVSSLTNGCFRNCYKCHIILHKFIYFSCTNDNKQLPLHKKHTVVYN